MGNSTSSGRGHHDETVDFGYLAPQGIYTGPRDWNQATVTQLIVERKLAPFYRPLEDYDETWDDDQILAARKDPPELESGEPPRADSVSSSSTKGHSKRPSAAKEPVRYPEAGIYRGAVECPICFLYYPSNINHSRCCDQAICTECFVQIKRVEPTTTHIVSEPAACPYCVQENFGIVYTPPPWRTGLGSEGATPPSWPDSPKAISPANPSMKRRRKSFGHDDPDVVTVDHIHPDWEAKLAAVRAAVARRANRRIIMRQVGDRLIPVGVTSGRVHALPTEDGNPDSPEGNGDRGSRRSRRRQQNPELNQFLGSMGIGGQDLEELMVMEAMRLSLLEHEAQQQRQQEEEAKKQQEDAAAAAATGARVSRPRPSGQEVTDAVNESNPAITPDSTLQNESLAPPAGEADSAPRSRTSSSSQTSRSTLPTFALLSPPDSSAVASERLQSEVAPVSARQNRSLSVHSSFPVADGGVPTISEPSSSDNAADMSIIPPLDHQQSFASSLASSSYDALPSSPESNNPLLERVTLPTTPAVENDSNAPSTT